MGFVAELLGAILWEIGLPVLLLHEVVNSYKIEWIATDISIRIHHSPPDRCS